MISSRLYRAGFLPLLLAVVVAMFSLEPLPDPLAPLAPPAEIDAGAALRFAATLESEAPEREPGNADDQQAAALVAEAFGAIEAGIVDNQGVEGSFEGSAVASENVVLSLPGDASRMIVVLAPRNPARGGSGTPSAAATGALVELAEVLAGSRHDATYVLASTAGTPGDALGAEELVEGLPRSPEAVVALLSPAASRPSGPFVLQASATTESASAGLAATAADALGREAGLPAADRAPGAVASLVGLALPSALGPQAGLIGAGVDAIGISSDGGPSGGASGGEEPSPATLQGFARATVATVEALDESAEPPPHGPGTYARVGDDLIPGWALAMLALAVLLPAMLASLDAVFRANRARDGQPVAALAWAGSRAVPLLAALAVALGCALVGLLPELRAPLPAAFGAGAGGVAAVVAILAAALGTAVALGGWRGPSGVPRGSAIAATGLVASLSGLAMWLANPYAALLAAPGCHAWVVLAGRGGDSPGRRAVAVVAALAGALPGLGALALASSSELLGGGSPWWALAALGDGRLNLGVVLSGCFLLGALAAVISLALGEGEARRRQAPRRGPRRGAPSWTDDPPSDRSTERSSGPAGRNPGGSPQSGMGAGDRFEPVGRLSNRAR